MLSNADLRSEDIIEKIDTLLKELDDLKPKAQQALHDLEEQENKLAAISEDSLQTVNCSLKNQQHSTSRTYFSINRKTALTVLNRNPASSRNPWIKATSV